MTNDTTQPIIEFLNRFTAALGVKATVNVEDTADGPRINSSGDEAEILVRHRGEPLKALQHVVDMAFGRGLPGEQRSFVDALEYRKGKDVELRQMAKLLAEKGASRPASISSSGRSIPTNAASCTSRSPKFPASTTESIGDAFSKTVLISARK